MQKNIFLSLCLLSACSVQAEEPLPDYPWLDEMHGSVANSVNSTALWFDDFFALKGFNSMQKADGEARILLAWEPRSRDLTKFKTRFKVSFKLPNLKNRADLIFSDEDDQDNENPLSTLGNQETPERNRFSLALRWKSKPDSGFSQRIGIGRRLQPFVKSRYRHAHFLSTKTTLSWETSAYYYSRDGLGTDLSWRFSYQQNDKSIIRQNNHYYYRDKENDWLWQHSFQHLNQIDHKNALISGIYFEGTSQPNFRLDEYLVSVRWRKNALREWLFYELEPFVMWRRDEGFSASYGIGLRLEGHFSKK
ncbi:hypothetical protein [Paraglaciecola sp. L3A3]|uniref:hypothetical protein n=1 Tax=Paraglaciecola sp. L3A3 TaxID=2686358 RepID=UPI001E2E596A|nr:hypothetical protein [Paraglaciecola sp. L3A3]